MNSFLNSIVENWLINVDERGLQFVYASYLIDQGYRILEYSMHGQIEDGKDLVYQKTKTDLHLAQLKVGDINGAIWEKIKGEIEELFELIPNIPNLTGKENKKYYLVTSGIVNTNVKRKIENYNRGSWKAHPLIIIDKLQILPQILEIVTKTPFGELKSYKSFLDLYFLNKGEFINERMFIKFFNEILISQNKTEHKYLKRRRLLNGIVIAGILVSGYLDMKNYICSIRIIQIFLLSAKKELCSEINKEIESLLMNELDNEVDLFLEEYKDKSIFDSELNIILDKDIKQYRVTLVLESLIPQIMIQSFTDKDKAKKNLEKLLPLGANNIMFYSERVIVLYIMIYWLLILHNEKKRENFLYHPLKVLIQSNYPLSKNNDSRGLADPYFTAHEILKDSFGIRNIDDNFIGESYVIKPLVYLIIENESLDKLKEWWKFIVDIQSLEVEIKYFKNNFIYRVNESEGAYIAKIFEQQERIVKLKEDIEHIKDDKKYNSEMRSAQIYMPLLFSIMPWRINTKNVLIFNQIIKENVVAHNKNLANF